MNYSENLAYEKENVLECNLVCLGNNNVKHSELTPKGKRYINAIIIIIILSAENL